MTPWLGRCLARTGLGWWPTRVRRGLNQGAWWTLYPHSAYWRGDFEPEIQAAIRRLQPAPGGCAWDLGAHFGFYTLALARAVGPTGTVLALEPDRDSFRRLGWHLRMNRLHQVRAVAAAASVRSQRQFLVQSEGGGATTSHLAYPGEVVDARTPGRWIDTIALDELQHEQRLPPPSLVKVDVEGHGAAALRGARRTLTEARPSLLMSFHSPQETTETAAVLEPLRYRPHDLTGAALAWPDTMFRTVVLRPEP